MLEAFQQQPIYTFCLSCRDKIVCLYLPLCKIWMDRIFFLITWSMGNVKSIPTTEIIFLPTTGPCVKRTPSNIQFVAQHEPDVLDMKEVSLNRRFVFCILSPPSHFFVTDKLCHFLILPTDGKTTLCSDISTKVTFPSGPPPSGPPHSIGPCVQRTRSEYIYL